MIGRIALWVEMYDFSWRSPKDCLCFCVFVGGCLVIAAQCTRWRE